MFRERKGWRKVMRENEPVLLVLSVCDGEIILEKGEILYEKCHVTTSCYNVNTAEEFAEETHWKYTKGPSK